MATTNPIQPVFAALWQILEDNAAFAAIVPVGCRLKNVGSSGNPLVAGSQAGDFPRVLIEPADGLSTIDWSNTDCVVKKRFQIKVATGNRQTDDAFELEWIVIAAMSSWRTRLEALTWQGLSYVRHLGVYKHEESEEERKLTKKETGWSVAYDGEVWMEFPQTDLVAIPR